MVMISVNKSYNKVRYPLKHRFTLVNDFSLGSLARDKHLILAGFSSSVHPPVPNW